MRADVRRIGSRSIRKDRWNPASRFMKAHLIFATLLCPRRHLSHPGGPISGHFRSTSGALYVTLCPFYVLVGAMLARPSVAPNADCVATSPQPQPQMVATTLREYDSTTLAWKGISTPVPETSVPSTDIVDERRLLVVALRKRRQQSKTTKGSATNKATSANITPETTTSRVQWRPTAMPRIAA
ncbi:hypothetical protein HPB51_005941 [Rhipicephalus microplus]|uniref:Uncharacterized protein n=1 Tax=Rhipicephalus microplus TaxID=6941 RepID=A0A9J6ERQ0_RHIMP|nr:hypothetical protein HPB51_005941 [Rhipicephalus microplus]